jgi:hypothetical protein
MFWGEAEDRGDALEFDRVCATAGCHPMATQQSLSLLTLDKVACLSLATNCFAV